MHGRIARWRDAELGGLPLQTALLSECCTWLRAGYPWATASQFWKGPTGRTRSLRAAWQTVGHWLTEADFRPERLLDRLQPWSPPGW